jgi:hypothetical protein
LGDPVIDTSPAIYELQIIEANNWKLEINMFAEEYYSPDSFRVKNKSDSAMVINYTRYDSLIYGSVFVVTQEDLSKSLNFDRDNDMITLCYFIDGEKFISSVKIGTYLGSYIHNLDSCQSICWDMYWNEHYKSNTPTIGADNTDEEAKIFGKIFDANGVAITNSTVAFYPIWWVFYGEYISEDGIYHAEFSPSYHSFNSFLIRHDNGFTQEWNVSHVELDLEPGDSIEVNFYSTMTSIKPVIQSPIILNNYPQPAADYSWFVIGNTDIEASAMRMNVYNLNGQKVDSFVPRSYQLRYDCSHLAQGTYIMSLQQNRKVLASKKLHIMK